MTTIFSAQKLSNKKSLSKISKRILGMESLETREMLSVNPLGIDQYSAPDFVQTDAGVATVDSSETTVTRETLFTLLADPTYSGTSATDSIVTPSGVTTNQVTLTWGKPTKYTVAGDNNGWKAALPSGATYSINVFEKGTSDGDTLVKTFNAGTKTSYTITSELEAKTQYWFTITAKLTLTDPADRTNTKTTDPVIVSTGTFTTEKAGDAAAVTVGAPTEVKATYVKGSVSKDPSVKVTWKAPANYTGGYEVTLNDGTNTAITRTVNPGSKLEITQNIGDAFSAGTADKDFSDAILAKDTRIKVTVTPKATKVIGSTPTYVNTGTVTAAVGTAPGVPTVTGNSKITDNPGGGMITLTADGGGTAAVGFYVGVGASAPAVATAADLAKLVYVPKGQSTTTVNLKLAASDKVWAFAVSGDGLISSASSAYVVDADDFTADIAAALSATEYPTASDVTGVTATADTTVKNKYTVTWTAAKDFEKLQGDSVQSGDTKYEVDGYRVTAISKDGLATTTEYVSKADQTKGAVFENLNFGAEYTFKVEALIKKTEATTTDWTTSPNITSEISIGSTKTATVAKVPTVAEDITGITEVADSNTGINVKLTLAGAKNGSNYIVTVTDNNKAVLYTGTVVGTATATTFDLNSDGGLTLTPKAKYTVTVQTVGSIPGTVSKGKTATITATDFISATLKDAKATTINSVEVDVVAPRSGAGASDKYYIEYTNVVDAKGKPDWNAAAVYGTSSTAPVAVADKDAITIGKLDPNSQYFFRVVTVDAEYSSGWGNVKKSVASKELKVKTAAVPLPTIAKNGFTLGSDSAFGLKLVGNSMARVDSFAATAKQALGALTPQGAAVPLYVYTLVASLDSKTDKATGKLLGAEIVKSGSTNVTLAEESGKTSATDKKVTDLSGEATFVDIFKTLGVDNNNFSGVKGLNVQVQVDVYYGDSTSNGTTSAPNTTTSDHFTLYSKASKIALPKWFV